MGTVNVRYYAGGGDESGGLVRPFFVPHPKASFRDGWGTRVDLPFAPTGGDLAGSARRWVQIERPGRTNILVDSGPGLRTVAYTLTVAYANGASIAAPLMGLQMLAARSDEVGSTIAVLGLSGLEVGPWRITDLTIKVQRREHGTNNPTYAEVEIAFGEVGAMNMGIARSGKKRGRR